MKQHLMKRISAAATLFLLIMGTSIAAACNIPENVSPEEGRFEISTPRSLTDGNDITVELKFLSSEYIRKMLAEKAAFTEETRPLLRDLKTKWAALAEELTDQTMEASTAVFLQQEISTLGARLAQKHFEHLLAIEEIKTDEANGRG